MILSDSAILSAIESNDIVLEPFDRKALNPNSYDVHLSKYLKRYITWVNGSPRALDCKKQPTVLEDEIPEEGLILRPGTLYLASTTEYTVSRKHVPYLDGKSSIGRFGIFIHTTAGRGDVGFAGHWTMEISVIHAIRVYPGMPIGQLTWHTVEGEILDRYDARAGSKYNNRDPKPQESRMWRNFVEAAATSSRPIDQLYAKYQVRIEEMLTRNAMHIQTVVGIVFVSPATYAQTKDCRVLIEEVTEARQIKEAVIAKYGDPYDHGPTPERSIPVWAPLV